MQQLELFTVRRRVTFEDPSLPHQIVIRLGVNMKDLVVSCTCLRRGRGAGRAEPLGMQGCWTAAEAMAVWRAHAEEANAA